MDENLLRSTSFHHLRCFLKPSFFSFLFSEPNLPKDGSFPPSAAAAADGDVTLGVTEVRQYRRIRNSAGEPNVVRYSMSSLDIGLEELSASLTSRAAPTVSHLMAASTSLRPAPLGRVTLA